jgi:hypothetical protein
MTRQEALYFLLTHIVVERQHCFELNPQSLFALMSIAGEAEQSLSDRDGLIPHEVLEGLAADFISDTLP